MLANVVAAFVGAFAAIAVIEETRAIASKAIRYLAAFILGALAAVILGGVLSWIAEQFAKLG